MKVVSVRGSKLHVIFDNGKKAKLKPITYMGLGDVLVIVMEKNSFNLTGKARSFKKSNIKGLKCTTATISYHHLQHLRYTL